MHCVFVTIWVFLTKKFNKVRWKTAQAPISGSYFANKLKKIHKLKTETLWFSVRVYDKDNQTQ